MNPKEQALWLAAVGALAGCGGGPKVTPSTIPDTFDVRVSAGAPVSGALVAVFAINDATGQVDATAGAAGVLGSAGPTDSSGRVTVTTRPYSGPVRIVASGPALFYSDPTTPPDGTGIQPVVQVPTSFAFTSYVSRFKASPMVVPVTLLTTLADRAALAYARGLVRSHPGPATISEALAARDPLLVRHVTGAAASWDPTTLRTTAPAALGTGPQSLVDTAFAAVFDLAMNQLARDTAVRAGYGTGPGGLTAPTLVQLLQDDLDADGRLDGAGAGGRPVTTGGSTPVLLDAQFLRKPLAVALLAWVRDTQLNRSGITDADLASALVFKSITEDTSDLFGTAPIEPFDPLDRTPPEVAFAEPPPAYTNTGSITLAVAAKDLNQVKAVYAQVGPRREVGVLQDGVWRIPTHVEAVGHSAVTVWAEDSAQPAPNSGLGGAPPYQLVLDVVYDPDAPAATYDATFASYQDERELVVATGADGLATVPAAYAPTAKVPIPLGGEIFKSATRLSAGGPPDASEIEGANAANVPVLRFAVPFNPRTDAPIVQATYRVAVSCGTCGPLPDATGSLLPSPTASQQAQLFDLPLSTETVSALATVVGPAQLDVSLDLADAAGNAATVSGFVFTFRVIGPPLAVAEDAGFSTYGDPRSTFPYKVAGASLGVDTYTTLWDGGSPNFFGGVVRLVRYVVSNPSPEPVALLVDYQQDAAGSWRMVESWPRSALSEPPSLPVISDPSTAQSYVIDGFQFYQALYWATPYGTVGANLPKTERAPYPCPGGHTGGRAAHAIGDTLRKYICSPVNLSEPVEMLVASASVVIPQVFSGYQQAGGEVLPPGKDASASLLVVPGAVGSTPGTLVLYLTRPVVTPRARPLRLNALASFGRYETYDYEILYHQSSWSITARTGLAVYEVFLMLRSGQYLANATESLAGQLTLTTQGLVANAAFGEPMSRYQETIARTLATH